MILQFLRNLQNQKNQSENKKGLILKNAIILLNGRQKVLDAFEGGTFPKQKQGKGLTSNLDGVTCISKTSDGKQLQILAPKQMLKRLAIALAKVKAGNTFKNLLKFVK